MMQFSAEVYRDAAQEHVLTASELYDAGRYVAANYLSGVAVESIFRAYRFRLDPVFDARHDLRDLYRISKFEEVVPAGQMDAFAAHLDQVASQWSNAHRYRSERALRSFLKSAKLDRGVRKGDFLKELTRRMVNAATQVVVLGVRKWQE